MQPHMQQYSLPLDRPRVLPEGRPHTVHASSFSGQKGLPRDDTAVSLMASHADPSQAGESLYDFAGVEDQPPIPDELGFASLRVQQRPSRRSVFKLGSYPTSVPESSNPTAQKSATLGRRFSRSYCKERMTDLKENMSKYATVRRSSTPQTYQSPFPAQPTSPVKRNGTTYGNDRPMKQNRHFLKQGDRKDTPAPPPFGLTRPVSRHAAPSTFMNLAGGERARQAAAAHKLMPAFGESPWDEQDDLNARRSRLGSLSSAADSGADLSSCCGSNASYQDKDGDVEMTTVDAPPPRPTHDPLKVLPSELSVQIFEYLDAQDLMNVELVCSSWRHMGKETSVWRNAYLRQFQRQVFTDPPPIQVGGAGCGRPNRPNQEWKKMYKARTQLEHNWRKGAKGAGKAIYLAGHTDSVYCLQFDEEKIITGSRDRTIRVWDINNFTCQRVIGGPNVRPTVGPKVLRTVDYPDFHLATASVNGTAYGETIYQTPSQWHDASILCLQYDDKILVTGSSDSDLLIWDIKTYEPIKRLRRHSGGVLDVALDAKHIVSCSKDSRIIVWDRETYEPKGELTGHRGPVNAVQLRGKYLVSASGDGIARLWDLEQMKLVKEFSAKERGLAAVEFSEDMKYVLAGGNDTITYKFETETGKEVKQFVGHSQLVRSLWLDSQNNRVVSGSYDLDLRVYDFVTGEEIWRAEEWTTSWMLAAKSDYRRIVATSQDGRILIIDFGLQKCRTPDDGQPIEDIDMLRGTDHTSAIQWRNPWELTRQRDREREQQRQNFFAQLLA